MKNNKKTVFLTKGDNLKNLFLSIKATNLLGCKERVGCSVLTTKRRVTLMTNVGTSIANLQAMDGTNIKVSPMIERSRKTTKRNLPDFFVKSPY